LRFLVGRCKRTERILPQDGGNIETLVFDDIALANQLFGAHNRHLVLLEEKTGARLTTRGGTLSVAADDPALGECLLNLCTQLYGLLKAGQPIGEDDFEQGLILLRNEPRTDLSVIYGESAVEVSARKTVHARTMAQHRYIAALRRYEMVFAVGPAGTGKTYLAVAMALFMLLQRRVRRIVLTRPAVEAGERLGFLPGDMADKVNPYLRPLHDALHDMLGPQKMLAMQESGIIEIAPLAFMRGRTLNDACVILDEAQNTTREQMKMFLTRLGFGSRAVITGDVTQIDLPAWGEGESRDRSGLVHALDVLAEVEGIAFCRFQAADVVRHPLVGRIVHAYQEAEARCVCPQPAGRAG
jgi:phosphate starvation-inducible PhoH-like protein